MGQLATLALVHKSLLAEGYVGILVQVLKFLRRSSESQCFSPALSSRQVRLCHATCCPVLRAGPAEGFS